MRINYFGFGDERERREFLWHLKGNALNIYFSDDHALEKRAQRVYSWYLRRLVNAWIATGRTGASREDPRERNLFTGPLYGILERWAVEKPIEIDFDRFSGEIILAFPDPNPITQRTSSPLTLAYYAAVRRFLVFLNSDDKHLLCRCRHCETYYYLQRRAKGPIEHGTYCPAHRQSASAKRSKEHNSKELDGDLVKLCAHAREKLPMRYQGDPSSQKAKAWVAMKITEDIQKKKSLLVRCKSMGLQDPQTKEVRVTGNWVTRHWEVTSEAEKAHASR